MGGAAVVLTAKLPLCPAVLLLGIPCPGCGLTRATLALLHGDLARAIHLHPLAPLLAPLFGAVLLKTLLDYVRGGATTAASPTWRTGHAANALAAALLVLVVGVWAARFWGCFGGPVAVARPAWQALTR